MATKTRFLGTVEVPKAKTEKEASRYGGSLLSGGLCKGCHTGGSESEGSETGKAVDEGESL